jgi:ubiquinone/menaquinone biosynthesis C-methylase UbiE
VPATIDHIDQAFGELYYSLRQKEHRVYTDAEVNALPVIGSSHPMYKEWIIRKKSSEKLVNWFRKKNKPLQILEIGCGNGWLSHRLSELPAATVTGIDINREELTQAQRVFSGLDRLHFIYGDMQSEELANCQFDAIVLAACVQYFSSMPPLVHKLFRLLKDEGEIHILDSPFYSPGEAVYARERSFNYYRESGYPEMSRYYFHHEVSVFSGFNFRVLYKPSFFQSVFMKNKNPFPWILIRKNNRKA